MKMDISWHRKNLTNRIASRNKSYGERERIDFEIRRQTKCIDILNNQILTAEKEGKIEFDEDKYLVRRSK